MTAEVPNWAHLLECPTCDTCIVVHDDKLHPGGELKCYDCDRDLVMGDDD